MKKYIDVDLLMEKITNIGDAHAFCAKVIEDVIKDMPIIYQYTDLDVIRHGAWLCIECRRDYEVYECSECGSALVRGKNSIPMFYCPNCGAKMDKRGRCKNEV